MWRFIIFAALLAMAGIAEAKNKIAVGDPVPDFALTLLDRSTVTRDDLRGKVVVLNFWATWCAPCKAELPLLDAYYAVHEKHGLKVFAIITQDSVPYSQLQKLFRVLRMPSVRKVKGDYGALAGLPTNFIIDRSGVIRYAKAGAFTLDQLNDLLIPLLNEPAPPATAP